MKLTLDHNVIIDLMQRNERVDGLREIIDSGTHQVFVVEVGASEMRELGVFPDRYDKFEELLKDAGIGSLSRLPPVAVWGCTFWERAVWSDQIMSNLMDEIGCVLFGNVTSLHGPIGREDAKVYRKWLNRICDVLTMWCHLYYGNDVFVTSDRNFHKETKVRKLIDMGAGRICWPDQLRLDCIE
ncbi:hypothetical protein ACFFU8_10750 [Chromobacterium piscinae]|uniref:hypothetical protein n=1 Tax=Chromobacterium piscinae TaxID=686831 RepID=UPI001E4C4DB9|nr:hypothetical protein [Chromobacterium piscinae]MCD5328104.1 hypothetical protein [Chromobacterium piscinae]